MPFSKGYVEVNSDECEGSVSGVWHAMLEKMLPPLAKASMFGVAILR
jgi:hypothetical protein